MAKVNFRQQKRQREDARKQRQQERLQRRGEKVEADVKETLTGGALDPNAPETGATTEPGTPAPDPGPAAGQT